MMTGLEALITKVSNATTTALRGERAAVVNVEAWSLDKLREAALQDAERDFERIQRDRRRAWRAGCM